MQTKTIPITILRNLFFMLSKLLVIFRFLFQTCWWRTAVMLFTDYKSTRDSRFSGAKRGGSYLDGTRCRSIPSRAVFSLPTGNEAPQDARYSQQESIEVHPLVPKGFLSVRQTGIDLFENFNKSLLRLITYISYILIEFMCFCSRFS